MKLKVTLLALGLLLNVSAHAALFTLSSGTLNRTSPQGLADLVGILLEIATAALLSSAGSIRLLTNGARRAICRPALHAGDA